MSSSYVKESTVTTGRRLISADLSNRFYFALSRTHVLVFLFFRTKSLCCLLSKGIIGPRQRRKFTVLMLGQVWRWTKDSSWGDRTTHKYWYLLTVGFLMRGFFTVKMFSDERFFILRFYDERFIHCWDAFWWDDRPVHLVYRGEKNEKTDQVILHSAQCACKPAPLSAISCHLFNWISQSVC